MKNKKNIYVAHSSKFDYQNELYKPIRDSSLNNDYNIVLPHEKSNEQYNSKEFLKLCDYMIVESSYDSTGLGIEIGWADIYDVKIICVIKNGFKISNSLRVITDKFITYKDSTELINELKKYI